MLFHCLCVCTWTYRYAQKLLGAICGHYWTGHLMRLFEPNIVVRRNAFWFRTVLSYALLSYNEFKENTNRYRFKDHIYDYSGPYKLTGSLMKNSTVHYFDFYTASLLLSNYMCMNIFLNKYFYIVSWTDTSCIYLTTITNLFRSPRYLHLGQIVWFDKMGLCGNSCIRSVCAQLKFNI